MTLLLSGLSGLAYFSVFASGSPLVQLKARAPPTISGWDYSGCFKESPGGRALQGASYFSDALTVELCASFCASRDYTVFGVEFGRECFCSTSVQTDSLPAPEEDCSFTCSGKASESCGAGDRLNVYHKQVTVPTSTSTPTPVPTTYTFQNCYSEATTGRALTSKATSSDAQTVANCAAECSGFKYFGLEYYFECFCGNELAPGSIAVGGVECNFPCTGDSSQTCGGASRLSLYSFDDNPAPSIPTSLPIPTPTTYPGIEALGCFSDSTGSRSLAGVNYWDDFMTIEKCSAACQGYALFGVEYSRECYCGDLISGGAKVLIEQCNMPCSGNSAQLCGAGDRLNVYKFSIPTTTSSITTTTTTTTTTTPIPEPTPGAGILRNGGFENGLAPWVLTTTANIDRPSISNAEALARGGTNSAQMVQNSALTGSSYTFNIVQDITVVPGTKYALSFWVKISAGYCGVIAQLSGVLVVPNSVHPASTEYIQYIAELVSPADITLTKLTIKTTCNRAGLSHVNVDDVTLDILAPPTPTATPTPTPTPTQSPVSVNVLKNGGFEEGLEFWQWYLLDNAVDPTISGNSPKEGTQFFQFSQDFTVPAGRTLGLSQTVPIVSGASYTLSFWVRRISGTCRLSATMSNRYVIPFTDWFTSDDWVKYTAELTSPASYTTTTVVIQIICSGSGLMALGLDDVVLELTPTGPPLPLSID